MSYDEEQHKRSRVVIETPTARREVVEERTVRQPPPAYYPPPERRGYSTGVLATVALLAIAATAIIFLFLTNSRDDSSTEVNINARAATQPTPLTQAPILVQTPLPQPTPIIIQQAPQTVPAPVIIQAPPTTTDPATTAPPASTAPPAAPPANDDATLQTKIDKAFADDPAVSTAVIDATVVNGRVRLSGTVNSDAVKQRAERLAYAVKGILEVDNKIVVSAGTP